MHYRDLLKKGPYVLFVIAIMIIAAQFISISSLHERLDVLVADGISKSAQLTEQLQRATDATVSKQQLEKQIDELIKDNEALKIDLKKLKAKIKSAGTIAIKESGKTETIVGTFPTTHIYRLDSGMPVARHEYHDNEFTAETYDIGINLNVVTAENKAGKTYTYVDSTMKSSGEDKEYPVQATATFNYIKPKSSLHLFDPHLNLGLTVPVPQLTPRASLGINVASIGETHYDNTVRFLNPNLELGKSFAIGVDPVGMNISKVAHIPLIQDTWLWAGVSNELVPNFGQYSLTLTLASTL